MDILKNFYIFLPSKFEIFLKLIPSILFFGKSLKSFFLIIHLRFFYHPFIIPFHHHFSFFLNEKKNKFIFSELTKSTQSNMSWLNNSFDILKRGAEIFAPFLIFFIFFFHLFFFTLASFYIVTIHKLLPFAFSSFPHHFLLRK